MTTPPLPDVPCVRVECVWNKGAVGEASTRFYLSYSGSAPSGANCTTLAGDIATAWGTDIAPGCHTGIVLNEVDVLDIATNTGKSGQAIVSTAGEASGTSLPYQCCMNVEYGVARRYRGGKPRGYWPFGTEAQLATQVAWMSSFLTTVATDVGNFFTAIEALSVGSMGTLAHVNLSYYQGFTNHTNTSGRERAVPTYRATALHDVVTGYFPKAIIGSQRRRRTSTTP